MDAHTKSRSWMAGLALALATLACTLTAREPTPTPTLTPETVAEEAALPPLPTVLIGAQDCTATALQTVNMRTGPGTTWPAVSQLAGGTSAKVTGHNGDRSWWQLNSSAWVSAPFVTTSGDCSNIPVASFPPPPPASGPAQAPQTTQAPTNTGAPPSAASPTATATATATLNVPPPGDVVFDVNYNSTWTCGSSGRVSFIIYNQGSVNLESVYYSVEAPTGTYLNSGTVNNAPFEASPTEPQPACAQPPGHGQESLAPGQGLYVPIDISSVPAGGTEGFLYIEACTQNNRSGDCEGQVLYFFF